MGHFVPMSTVRNKHSMCSSYRAACDKNWFIAGGRASCGLAQGEGGIRIGNFEHMCLKKLLSQGQLSLRPDRNLLPYFFWDMQGTNREIPYNLKKFKQQQNLTIRNEKRLLNNRNDPVSISCTYPKCNSQAIFFVSVRSGDPDEICSTQQGMLKETKEIG